MRLRIIIALFILSALINSCIDRNNMEFSDIPIIEGYLRPGDYVRLKVGRQIPFSSNVTYSSDDINALKITITNNNTDYLLTPLGNGKYIDSSLIVSTGERYDLSFKFNSKTVSAYTTIPFKPVKFAESDTSISVMRMDSTSTPTAGGGMWIMPTPITLTWTNSDESYYIVVVENMEDSLDPVRQLSSTDTIPFKRFNKPPTTASGLEMRAQEFTYFGRDRLILYHVLPDYASLYETSSNSSQNLTNPSTSITNGYGIFTGLNADTLFLTVLEATK
ncbi:MAG: DUF4249 family protein [Bacteroidales bacterium]